MKKLPRLVVVSSAVLRGVRTEHARAVRRIYGDRGGGIATSLTVIFFRLLMGVVIR